jgi:F0F1-type ATP synthase epsilon subunit
MDTETSNKAKKTQEETIVPQGKMLVKVYAPFRNYFEGPADSISAVNDTGSFDILRGHHRFLTLLSPCELDIRTENGSEKIKIDMGVMFVKADRVTVFLDV